MSKQKKKEIMLSVVEIRAELAEKEARFLLLCFGEDGACKHIDLNLARSKPFAENDAYEFWKEVRVAFDTIIVGKSDEIEECIHLLDFVNSMKPQKKWVAPLLESAIFSDFRTRLFLIIEDYKNEWINRK